MEDSFDSILVRLGTGKWNMFYYISLAYMYAGICYHTLGGAFFAPKVEYTCQLPSSSVGSRAIFAADNHRNTHNSTSLSTEHESAFEAQSSCTYFEQDNTTNTVIERECVAWDFDNSTFVSTVTSEFGLACQWEYLRATYQSIYMTGMFFGAAISGYMADRYGRRTTLMVGATCYSVLAIGSAWLPTISTILAARFLLGVMHPMSLQTGFILAMEVTEPKKRIQIGVLQFISWAIATSLWGVWAYLIRDWRWLQLAVSLPTLLFLPSLWIMDESPRWLIVAGRHSEALRVLQKAAKRNNARLPPAQNLLELMVDTRKRLGHNDIQEARTSLCTEFKRVLQETIILFRTPRLRAITLIMCADYFAIGMVYFGLNLSGGLFKVDRFLYMVISGICELPSSTVVIPIMEKFGYKKSTIFFFLACGIFMFMQSAVPTDYNWLMITVVMMAKLSISMAFQIIFLYASELFPTEVRTRGVGITTMSSRGGAVLAPYFTSFIGSVYPWSTSVVFGAAAMIAGLVALPLRDTFHSVLLETVMDLESEDKHKRNREEGKTVQHRRLDM